MSPHDTWGSSRGQSIGHGCSCPPCHPAGAAHATMEPQTVHEDFVKLLDTLSDTLTHQQENQLRRENDELKRQHYQLAMALKDAADRRAQDLCRFQSHILNSLNFNSHQSAYRPYCSTKTALQLLLDHVYSSADQGKPTLLISLDLSAAFDTVNHSVLLKRLSCSFGVTGNFLSWIQSYLCDRTQSVRVGSHSSPPNPCLVGVPQGSVFGPLLFSIYTSPISTIAESHHVSQQQYADDTQLYIALLPANYNQDITALELCLNSLRTWLCENGMALNPTKSVAILFGTSQKLKSFSSLNSGTDIQLSDKLKILRATLDSNLTMESHIKALSSSCFYHIRSFKQIRSSLDYVMAISVASALVSSRLDHVNSILYGAASKHTNSLQRFRKHWLELLCISAHMALHSHPLHYSKTFIGYLLNGVYASNWQP